MTDRIKILCSKCRKPFGERAQRLSNGYQVKTGSGRRRAKRRD
jgi:hypothetical protein